MLIGLFIGLNTLPPSPPSINIHPPPVTSHSEFIPPATDSMNTSSYIPPAELSSAPPRAASQPPSTRKSVQFAASPVLEQTAPVSDPASVAIPEDDIDRRRRRHRENNSRGYEAGEDTDSPMENDRSRHHNSSTSSRSQSRGGLDPSDDPSRSKDRHHRRRRSHEPSSSSSKAGARLSAPSDHRESSPGDSDATEELPPRFDREGRKKPEGGNDPLANTIDDILAGKGMAGKAFGNFMDGIFGPDGRKGKGR